MILLIQPCRVAKEDACSRLKVVFGYMGSYRWSCFNGKVARYHNFNNNSSLIMEEEERQNEHSGAGGGC